MGIATINGFGLTGLTLMTALTGAAVAAEGANPLAVNTWEIVVMLGLFGLPLIALVLLAVWLLRAPYLTATQRLVGLLLGVILPLLGPVLVWLVLRREAPAYR